MTGWFRRGEITAVNCGPDNDCRQPETLAAELKISRHARVWVLSSNLFAEGTLETFRYDGETHVAWL